MEIAAVIQDCWQIAEDHLFHKPDGSGLVRTFGDTCTLITSEVSEAYEAFRKDGNPRSIYTEVDGKPEGPPVELVDVVIRVFDTLMNECELTADEVVQVMRQKMEYNRRRPPKHGKVI